MKINRIQQIEDYINQNQTVSIDELREIFKVSKNTIRRDIKQLEEKGVLKKVYGGVVAVEPSLKNFETRNIDHQEDKMKIANKAAELIKPNDIIFIDSGTTTKNILLDLNREIPFTLITNNLDVINLAIEFPFVEIILIGSTYKRLTRSFVDTTENLVVSKLNIDIAFMAATGFSINNGMSNADPLEHAIKKQIVNRAQQVFLLSDISKLGKSALYSYAPLDTLKGIIVNESLSEEYLNYFEEHQITVYVV
ncbi:MAG: DeoR/GlpR transcriptional regulator [Carnobacterium sp.]|nr:DeoR/GlpR transcriptional regulator [Carnobacterium sp.]